MKSLAIDFGERGIGLALSDPRGSFAVPIEAIARSSDRQAIAAIAEVVAENEIEQIIVGLPLGLDGHRGTAATRVESFVRKLTAKVDAKVRTFPETLTTVEAERMLQDRTSKPIRAGNQGRASDNAHSVAAQVLLQDFLDHSRRLMTMAEDE